RLLSSVVSPCVSPALRRVFFVAHADDDISALAAGRRDPDLVVDLPPAHGPPERRVHADVALVVADLVGPDEPVLARLAIGVLELEPRAEVDPGRIRRRPVDDGHAVEALAQVVHAAVDLGELLLAVDVLGVLRAVALRGRLRDGPRDFRAPALPELVELRAEPFRAFPGDELRAGRPRRAIAAHNTPRRNMRY